MRMTSLKSWLLLALFAPVGLLAQKEDLEKGKIKEKEKEKKEVQQIIITRKGDKKDKIVVEINEDKVTINGKPVEDFKEGDINVMMKKMKDMESLTFTTGSPGQSRKMNNNVRLMTTASNRAMLGVTTETVENGAKVNNVAEGSAAEKAGLKVGDIITRIGEDKIEKADDLSTVIKKFKPGEKVNVTWLRENKEQKATAELGKWKGMDIYQGGEFPVQEFRIENFNNGMNDLMPRLRELQEGGRAFGPGFSWNGNGPKMGLSVQDTDDGKGVKVIEVDDEGNAAKAGIKEGDVISEFDGKVVNSTDEVVKAMKESKEKISVMVKLQRNGKTQQIEVKMPRKLKTADL